MATSPGGARSARVVDGVDELAAAGRELRAQVEQKTQQAKQAVQRKSTELKGEVEQHADRWTTAMGEQIERVSRALASTSATLHGEGEGRLASVFSSLAEQVERVGGYLEGEKPQAMMRDLEETARRNPAAFLGTTMIAGLLIGRFLRSSEPGARAEEKRRETRDWLRAEATRLEEEER